MHGRVLLRSIWWCYFYDVNADGCCVGCCLLARLCLLFVGCNGSLSADLFSFPFLVAHRPPIRPPCFPSRCRSCCLRRTSRRHGQMCSSVSEQKQQDDATRCRLQRAECDDDIALRCSTVASLVAVLMSAVCAQEPTPTMVRTNTCDIATTRTAPPLHGRPLSHRRRSPPPLSALSPCRSPSASARVRRN